MVIYATGRLTNDQLRWNLVLVGVQLFPFKNADQKIRVFLWIFTKRRDIIVSDKRIYGIHHGLHQTTTPIAIYNQVQHE